jgi:phosphoserine phosphatase RsbU/P
VKKIWYLVVILCMVALNVLFFERASDFCHKYPLGRLIFGNTLLFKISSSEVPWPYGSVITEVNGAAVGPGDAGEAFYRSEGEKLFITVEYGEDKYHSEFVPDRVNSDLFWFFLFLIICADIHFFWAIFVQFVYPYRYLARLFVYFGISLGVHILSIIEIFSYSRLTPVFIASGAAVGFLGMLIGLNLANRKMGKLMACILAGTGFVMTAVPLVFPAIKASSSLFAGYFAYLTGCALFAIARLASATIRNPSHYLINRNISIILCMIGGFLAPAAFFMSGFYADLMLPVTAVPVMTLVIPLFIGTRLLENNSFDMKVYFDKGAIITMLNLVIAFIGGFFLFYISNAGGYRYQLTAYYTVFVVLMIYLLDLKHFLNVRINNAVLKLRDYYSGSLQHITELVSSPAELPAKLGKIFGEVRSLTGSKILKLVLFDERQGEAQPETSSYLEHAPGARQFAPFFKANRGVLLRYTLIMNDEQEEKLNRFLAERGALMAVPLVKGTDIHGALLVGEKASGEPYTEEEFGYLQTVSLQLYQLLENDRLFSNYIIKKRYERELDIASSIQLRLFPTGAPERCGLQISFHIRPYSKVTGDYFDFIPVGRDRTAIVMGDVSGHGLAASMILSMTSSIVNSLLGEKMSIEKVIEEINHFLNVRYNGVDLITLFIGVYNKKSRELVYINAGHCTPILLRAGRKELSYLEGRSKILGADPSANYFSSRLTLARGDEIVMYTDGLVEIFDEKSEPQFNEKSVADILQKTRDKNIDEKVSTVIEAMEKYRDSIRDDLTIIGFKVQ